MPWNDQSGGRGGGPWGNQPPGQNQNGPQKPWGSPPRPPQNNNQGPDLEDMLRRLQKSVRSPSGGGGGKGLSGPGLLFLAAGVFVAWLGTGVYVVAENERAVVTRFGAFARESGPGLHVHLPWPMESRALVNVSGQQNLEIGAETSDTPRESNLMLTRDEALISVNFDVVYQINEPRNYVFEVRDPEEVILQVGESAMREVVAQTNLDAITTTERSVVESRARDLMQQTLNAYQAGVQIVRVQLKPVSPPNDAVRNAFAEVDRARQDAVSKQNEATRYKNEIVPQARGEAARMIAEAEGYRESVVRQATGEAERFNLIHEQYRRNPRVTRERMYLETMERVYGGANKIIVDGRTGVQPYLPLEQLRRAPPAPSTGEAPATTTQPQLQQGAR
jgi:membrane protease subunit HflK